MFHAHIFGGTYIMGKIKLRNLCINTQEVGALLFGILGYMMILRFRLETIHFHSNKCCFILLNKFILC